MNTQPSDSEDESYYLYNENSEKGFTYESEIESLNLPSRVKQKILKLCKEVEKTFTLSPEQREKIQTVACSIKDLKDMKSEFTMGRGLYKRDDHERPFNMSAFSPEEVVTVKKNYYDFCKRYGFDVVKDLNIFLPSTFARRNGIHSLSIEQLQLFCRYLTKNLPDRPPRSVYTKFVKIFYAYRKGKFSDVEDELLLMWYSLKPGNFVYSVLGRILRRSRLLVRRRVLRLLDDDIVKNRKSHIPLWAEDIKDRYDDEYPDWTKNEEAWKEIANTHGQSSVKELKKAYFRELYPSARISKKVGSVVFKRRLIDELISMENATWGNVDWTKLGETCYNVGAVGVYSVIRMLTKKYVPREHWTDLAAAVKIIKKEHRLFRRSAKNQMHKGRKAEDDSRESSQRDMVDNDSDASDVGTDDNKLQLMLGTEDRVKDYQGKLMKQSTE